MSSEVVAKTDLGPRTRQDCHHHRRHHPHRNPFGMDSYLHQTTRILLTMLLIHLNQPHQTLFLHHLDDSQSLHLLAHSEDASYACAANMRQFFVPTTPWVPHTPNRFPHSSILLPRNSDARTTTSSGTQSLASAPSNYTAGR